jgi:HAD superfamily hydrolase (TIGR01490 family)
MASAQGVSIAPPPVEARQRSTRRDGNVARPRLVFFDLDHTLLAGDSDVLWCDFLVAQGVLQHALFAKRNADIEARYKLGQVDPVEFANFYVSTLAGRTPDHWEVLRQQFMRREIAPRIPHASLDLVAAHQTHGDLVVLTTATNRFLTELTAMHLGFTHMIATEPELVGGVFTGKTTGVLNMRAGKVSRLHTWLAARGASLEQYDSMAYSDSINDLPLLEAVGTPVAVNADARLADIAAERGWKTMQLQLPSAG